MRAPTSHGPVPVEAFGLSVLEALACGTPVVTGDRGRAREPLGAGCGTPAAPDPSPWRPGSPVLARAAGTARVAARRRAEIPVVHHRRRHARRPRPRRRRRRPRGRRFNGRDPGDRPPRPSRRRTGGPGTVRPDRRARATPPFPVAAFEPTRPCAWTGTWARAGPTPPSPSTAPTSAATPWSAPAPRSSSAGCGPGRCSTSATAWPAMGRSESGRFLRLRVADAWTSRRHRFPPPMAAHAHLNLAVGQRAGAIGRLLVDHIDRRCRLAQLPGWFGEMNTPVGRRAGALERLGRASCIGHQPHHELAVRTTGRTADGRPPPRGPPR